MTPCVGAAELEVHVAEVILAADDVGERGVALELPSTPYSVTRPQVMPATGFLIGTPASISASTPEQTLAIEVEPLDSMTSLLTRMAYGNLVHRRNDRLDGALGERAVADFAAARAAGAAGFADAERREVVVQDEALRGLAAGVAVEILGFVGGRERREGDRLRFAALEERAAVRAREQADFGAELADLIEVAAVAADLFVEDADAEGFLLQVVEGLADLELAWPPEISRGSRADFVLERVDRFLRATLPGV